MHKSKRSTIEGWIDKARNQVAAAEGHLKSHVRYSECIEASQECVELSVKAVLSLLEIQFPRKHWWNHDTKDFLEIAQQIGKRELVEQLAAQGLGHTVPLPRLLFLANFWAQFYTTAKYGFNAGYLAPAQDLFRQEEAHLAVTHAAECLRAASALRYLDADTLTNILSG